MINDFLIKSGEWAFIGLWAFIRLNTVYAFVPEKRYGQTMSQSMPKSLVIRHDVILCEDSLLAIYLVFKNPGQVSHVWPVTQYLILNVVTDLLCML